MRLKSTSINARMDPWKPLLDEICEAVNEIFVELELDTGRNGCVIVNSENIKPNGFQFATEDSLDFSHLVALRIPKSIKLPKGAKNQLPDSHNTDLIESIVQTHNDFIASPDSIDGGPFPGNYLLISKRVLNVNNK